MRCPNNMTLALAGVVGATAVMAGAFGAHGLATRLSPEMLEVFEVGARYHMYHALALLAVAGLATKEASAWQARAVGAWLFGVLVFSGSLYLLAITGIRWLGAITPIGGVALIAGWCCLAAEGLTRSRPR